MFGASALTPGLSLFGEGALAGGSLGGINLVMDGRGQIDSDASAFIAVAAALPGGAAIALSAIQKNAIHFLVGALKWTQSTIGGSLWSRCTAIYPFLGADGTGTGGKLNCLDLKGSWNCTQNGTITHNANGVTGNGSTGYLDTGIIPSAALTANSQHLSIYSRTASSENSVQIGASNGTRSSRIYLQSATAYLYAIDCSLDGGDTALNTQKLFMVSRTSATMTRCFRDGKFVGSTTNTSGASIAVPLFICAQNNSGAPSSFSSRNLAFASIGLSMSDLDAKRFDLIMRSFQDMLGRRV